VSVCKREPESSADLIYLRVAFHGIVSKETISDGQYSIAKYEEKTFLSYVMYEKFKKIYFH